MNTIEIKRVLSGFDLFRHLDEEEMCRIIDISISRNWIKGSHIFLQDEPLENVYFIKNGKIKIYKTDANGKEQIVAIMKNGDMFPHVGFFRSGGYPANSEVMETAALIVIPIRAFEKVLIENPKLSIKVFKVLGEKIVDLQERLADQILNNTYEQILKLLVRMGKQHGEKHQEDFVFLKAEFTNKDLANMIGTTRETVSRTLSKMKKEGLLSIDAKGNMIFSPERLLEKLLCEAQ